MSQLRYPTEEDMRNPQYMEATQIVVYEEFRARCWIPRVKDGVCTWCRNLGLRRTWKYLGTKFEGHIRWFNDVDNSARKGCQICALLSAGLLTFFGRPESELYKLLTQYVTTTLGDDKLVLVFRYKRDNGGDHHSWSPGFEFCAPDVEPFFTVKNVPSHAPAATYMNLPNSLAYMPMVVADPMRDLTNVVDPWIKLCDKYHMTCRSSTIAKRLPRRLLDVGLDDSDKGPHLYETKENETGRYVALSHCWGSGQHFITEMSSLQDRLEGMSWKSLPKTFQDAIIVTRRLHIKYLWIDSLCIVQDDKSDWDEQLMQMGAIYEDSYITIAAVSAANDQAGFLGTRDVGQALDLDRSLLVPSNLRVQVGRRKLIRPLRKRAWAFQERILSSRTLSFCDGEMTWDCNMASYTESGRHFHGGGVRKDMYRLTLQEDDPFRLDAYEWWLGIVVPVYSGLKLTKESDKLPALSAIADKIRLGLHEDYLAGLWKKDLFRGLLWHTGFVEPSWGYLPADYRAPTWSWASVETKYIRFRELDDLECQMTVLDAQCETAGSGPTGAVRSGSITLKCRCASTTMHVAEIHGETPERSVAYTFGRLSEYDTSLVGRFWPDVPLTSGQAWKEEEDDDNLTAARSSLKPGERRSAFTAPVSCVLISSFRLLGSDTFYLLVLGRSSRVSGAYERLGLLELYCEKDKAANDWEDKWFDETWKEFVIV